MTDAGGGNGWHGVVRLRGGADAMEIAAVLAAVAARSAIGVAPSTYESWRRERIAVLPGPRRITRPGNGHLTRVQV